MARPTTKEKKDAIKAMKAAAKIMKSKTASKAQKAAAKRSRDAANIIRKKGGTITELRAIANQTSEYIPGVDREELPEWKKGVTALGTKELYDTTLAARKDVENMSFKELANYRKQASIERARYLREGGQPLETHRAAAQMRAAGDRMRAIQGRQVGEGTAYTSPGIRVALDAKGNIQTDDQGRVVYDVDPSAYSGRFITPFTPTKAQIAKGKELFPDYGITGGLLTPWQQVNIQWMTGSKSDKLGLLSDMGVKATDKNLGLFTDDLKEGRIPAAFQQAWREEKWGDVKDPQTGLWKPAQGAVRQQAIAKQLERYEGGYFNPTTGKGGATAGTASQWGPGTGLIHPEDFVPEGWTGPLPAPGMGITGIPTGIKAPGGGGQHPIYAADPYTVPHMQTGGAWEGLGAEYQPGTVEGLSLLAGDPYTGYQPMDRGLLGAQPAFMGTPSGFTPMDFKGGLDLGGDTTTNTNNNTNVWGPGGTGLWHGGQLYTTPMSFHKAVTGG